MTGSSPPTRAVQYLRMSTDRQDYSLTYQATAIASYAAGISYDVVRSYVDEGVSGLGIDGRDGLKSLLSIVTSGAADFSVILVYDVSRWGRFQNPDQAAHYEFVCAEAGVRVEYCAEQFSNDKSPISGLIKHIKRAMAAEYSRELSEKVRRAQTGLKGDGFWMGSTPGFGFRREAVGRDGLSLGLLNDGQYNPYPGAHTRLALGPPDELETVRNAFSLYLQRGATFASVAADLNRNGGPRMKATPWTATRVSHMLSDLRYVGRASFGRSRTHLGERKGLPRAEWKVTPLNLPPIISETIFNEVQVRRGRRYHKVTRDQIIADIKKVYRLSGVLSYHSLSRFGKWTPMVYTNRFGTIADMHTLCGVTRPSNYRDRNLAAARQASVNRGLFYTETELLRRLSDLLKSEGRLTARIINASASMPNLRTYQVRFGSLSAAYARIGYRAQSPRQAAAMANALRRPVYDRHQPRQAGSERH